MDLQSIVSPILQNQFATGLGATALMGGAVYQLRNIPRLIHRGTLRFLTVEMTLISTDQSFDWMDRWLATQPYAKKSKMLTVTTHQEDRDHMARSDFEPQSNWSLSPGPGSHFFWWRHHPIFLERHFLSKEGESARRGKPVEKIQIRTIGRSQKVMRTMLDEVRNFSKKSDLVSIRVWGDDWWTTVRGKGLRPLDTIILESGQKDRILADIQWFSTARDWYVQRGIPYRRGYLFSGSPGTGKTSLVLSLAGHLGRPICVLNLGSVSSDERLFSAINEAPPNAIIVIEDIDCAFSSHSREKEDEKEDNKVTKAGLLNALDGITTPDGRIFILTTNYPERLDAALIRPGRCDVHEKFHYLGADEQREMANRFYDQPFEPLPFSVSPAVMQAAFMQFPHNPTAARARIIEVNDAAPANH